VTPEERAEVLDRLTMLNAIDSALDRRADVVDIVAASPTEDAAAERVGVAFGLTDPIHALAVVSLQFRQLTQDNRDRIRDDIRDLRAYLDTQ
jgi:DNA gyrase/topoisomerase IV subunit A